MRRHDFDPLSFVAGLLFAGVGLVLLGGAAVPGGSVGASLALPWVGPLVAVVLGVLVVIAARPRREGPEPEPGRGFPGVGRGLRPDPAETAGVRQEE